MAPRNDSTIQPVLPNQKAAIMADTLTPEHRSWLMSRIRSRDTTPEWILRSALHRLGFRFRVHPKGMTGTPDIVLPKHRTAIFVHGCFWHRHRKGKCRRAGTPKSNQAYWQEKFERNVKRDERNRRRLRREGWRVVVVWECQLLDHTIATIERVVRKLLEGQEAPTAPSGYGADLDRKGLLKVAEERVRYRLDRGGSGV